MYLKKKDRCKSVRTYNQYTGKLENVSIVNYWVVTTETSSDLLWTVTLKNKRGKRKRNVEASLAIAIRLLFLAGSNLPIPWESDEKTCYCYCYCTWAVLRELVVAVWCCCAPINQPTASNFQQQRHSRVWNSISFPSLCCARASLLCSINSNNKKESNIRPLAKEKKRKIKQRKGKEMMKEKKTRFEFLAGEGV